MILNFNNIEETVLPQFKGGEKDTLFRMYTDSDNKILQGKLVPGASIGLHKHETSSEAIFILQGTGKVLFNGEYELVEPGVCHYCPKGQEHSLINDGEEDLIFFAVVPEHR